MQEKDFKLFSQDSRMTNHEIEKKINVVHRDLHGHIRELRKDLNAHVKEQSDRYEEMVIAQQLNTQALIKLTKSTEGLVEVWTAGNGAIKVITTVGKALVWTSGVIVACGAVWAFFTHK